MLENIKNINQAQLQSIVKELKLSQSHIPQIFTTILEAISQQVE